MCEIQKINEVVVGFIELIKNDSADWQTVSDYYELNYDRLNQRWNQWSDIMADSKHQGEFYRDWC